MVCSCMRLPEFLFADCGDEFLEVEWLEVCDVLEVSGAECRDGRGEHRRCLRMALAEVRVRVPDDIGAFAGSVSYEEDRALLQVF